MEEKARQGWWRRLRTGGRDEFQLIVRNVSTYDEVGNYQLTPLNGYLLAASILLVLAAIMFLLIAYTPLRTYVPGYGDVVQRREVQELRGAVDELGELVTSQELYIENLRRTVLGEAITADSLEERSTLVVSEETEALPPSVEEMELRREMEAARRGNTAAAPGTLPAPLPSPGSNATSLAQVYLVVPVNGEVSARFNQGSEHNGVDILAPQHTAIKATRAGIVFMSEFTPSNGNVVGIQHDNNLISFYKHNSQLLKQVGDRVKAGEAIAIIGDTGTQSTGPHLHFELWYEGRAVDPGEYLSF